MNYLGSIQKVWITSSIITKPYTLSRILSLPLEEIEYPRYEGSKYRSSGKDSDAGIYFDNEVEIEISGMKRVKDFSNKVGKFFAVVVLDMNDDYYLIAPHLSLLFKIASESITNSVTQRPGFVLSLEGKSLDGAIPLT